MDNKKNLKEEEIKTHTEIQQEAEQATLQKSLSTSNEQSTQFLVLSDTFTNLLQTCFGNMPFYTILQNEAGKQTRLCDMLNYLEENKTHCGINELEQCVSFIVSAPYSKVRPLMEYIEDNKKQEELWKVIQD